MTYAIVSACGVRKSVQDDSGTLAFFITPITLGPTGARYGSIHAWRRMHEVLKEIRKFISSQSSFFSPLIFLLTLYPFFTTPILIAHIFFAPVVVDWSGAQCDPNHSVTTQP